MIMSIQYWAYNSVGSRSGPFQTYSAAQAFRMLLGLTGPIVQEEQQ